MIRMRRSSGWVGAPSQRMTFLMSGCSLTSLPSHSSLPSICMPEPRVQDGLPVSCAIISFWMEISTCCDADMSGLSSTIALRLPIMSSALMVPLMISIMSSSWSLRTSSIAFCALSTSTTFVTMTSIEPVVRPSGPLIVTSTVVVTDIFPSWPTISFASSRCSGGP